MTDSSFSNIEILHFLVFLNTQIDKGNKTEFTIDEDDYIKWSNDFTGCWNYLNYLDDIGIIKFDPKIIDDSDTVDELHEVTYYLPPYAQGTIFIEKYRTYFESKLDEMQNEIKKIEDEKNDVLGFNPKEMNNKIRKTKKQAENFVKKSKDKKAFKVFEDDVNDLMKCIESIESVNENYDDVFKNITNPITSASNKGIFVTVIVAIISIVATFILNLF